MPPQKHLCKQSVACCQGLMRTTIFKLILYDEKQHVPMLMTIALKMMRYSVSRRFVRKTFCQDRLRRFVRKTFCQDQLRRFVRKTFCQDRFVRHFFQADRLRRFVRKTFCQDRLTGGHFLGISWAYLWHILGISWANVPTNIG